MNKPPKDIAGETPALRPETRRVVSGRDPLAHHGHVNPPVYHASTLLYPTAEDLITHRARADDLLADLERGFAALAAASLSR